MTTGTMTLSVPGDQLFLVPKDGIALATLTDGSVLLAPNNANGPRHKLVHVVARSCSLADRGVSHALTTTYHMKKAPMGRGPA